MLGERRTGPTFDSLISLVLFGTFIVSFGVLIFSHKTLNRLARLARVVGVAIVEGSSWPDRAQPTVVTSHRLGKIPPWIKKARRISPAMRAPAETSLSLSLLPPKGTVKK